MGAKFIDNWMKDIPGSRGSKRKGPELEVYLAIHKKQGVQYGWRREQGNVVGNEIRNVEESNEGDTYAT